MPSSLHRRKRILPDYLSPQVLHQDLKANSPQFSTSKSTIPICRAHGTEGIENYQPGGSVPDQKPTVMFRLFQQLDGTPKCLAISSKTILYQKHKKQQKDGSLFGANEAWRRGRVIEMLIDDTGCTPNEFHNGDVVVIQDLRVESLNSTSGLVIAPSMPLQYTTKPLLVPYTPLFEPSAPSIIPGLPGSSRMPGSDSMKQSIPGSTPTFQMTDGTILQPTPCPASTEVSKYKYANGRYQVAKGQPPKKNSNEFEGLLNKLNRLSSQSESAAEPDFSHLLGSPQNRLAASTPTPELYKPGELPPHSQPNHSPMRFEANEFEYSHGQYQAARGIPRRKASNNFQGLLKKLNCLDRADVDGTKKLMSKPALSSQRPVCLPNVSQSFDETDSLLSLI